jgi:hypothetical protein
MTTHNSSTSETINNSNKTEVTNIVNKVVKCDCEEKRLSTQKSEIYTIRLTDPEQVKLWEEHAEAIRKIHETIEMQLALIKSRQK